MVCIPLQDCAVHDHGHTENCGHGDHHATGSQGHHHGPLGDVLHPDDVCGCHVHVPVPAEEQTPNDPSPSRHDTTELRAAFAQTGPAAILRWELTPPREIKDRFHPPDFSASDQVLALNTTRLIV
jgi:hypothetical protein